MPGIRKPRLSLKPSLPRHMPIDDETELQAAAFRRLLAHLQQRSDVQNIDLMISAGFCRNCLANWYQEAAGAAGTPMDKETARERVYGMPFAQWKAQYQLEATPEQLAAFEAAQRAHP
jgi:hypothetical protein